MNTTAKARRTEKLAERAQLWASLPDDALIDVQELCAIRRRSKAATYRDIAAGIVEPPIKVGASSRWRMGYVRALLAGAQ